MGTISAIIIICCLIISAALTVIVILVTVPDENNNEYNGAKFWAIQENAKKDGFLQNKHLNVKQNTITSFNYANFARDEKLMVPQNLSVVGINAETTSGSNFATNTATTFPTNAVTTRTFSPITVAVLHENEVSLLPIIAVTFRIATASSITFNQKLQKISSQTFAATSQQNIITTSTAELPQTVSKQYLTKPLLLKSAKKPAAPRQNHATITLQQKIEQLYSKEFATKIESERRKMTQMMLLWERTFGNSGKIVGLAIQNGFLYVGTNDGQVRVLDPKSGEQLKNISIGGNIDRMTISSKGDIIVLNGTELISYQNNRKYRKMSLQIGGKGLAAIENQRIIFLGRNNDVIFVFTEDLKPIDEIYYKNEAKETCNFVRFYHKHYYVSCQSAILKISEDGEIDGKIGTDKGTFSLGLSVDDRSRIIVAVRGQPILRIFQVEDGKLVRNLSIPSTDEMSVFCSEILCENGRLHIVDYLTSTLKSFDYPTQWQYW